ncbi:MAG TPA: 4-hydroxy-3-methylbut-2-enyl diphosphate reductase [Streptosporangiaceae bacterium]
MSPTRPSRLVVCAPLGIEAHAVSGGLSGARVVSGCAGPERAAATARDLAARSFGALAVVGFGGALVTGMRPGDVVVATEVRDGTRTHACPSAPLLAGELRRAGLTVRTGPVLSTDHVVRDAERHGYATSGALAVDMESAYLAEGAGDRPLAVVRVIVDSPERRLMSPKTVTGGITARRVLCKVGPAVEKWAAAVSARPRTVLLAGPRSFCAGVERAIEIVEKALEMHGAPVYVRKQIVHNRFVVEDLERRGAVFVEELDEVPDGALTVFSAHGVAPSVREQAERHDLSVIDATCPLVTKVHAEARRYATRGDLVVLIGHAGHEEVEGTLGEAPSSTVLVETPEDVERLEEPAGRVSYLMQTTLAADEAADVVAALKRRFPHAREPRSDDICYATTNRQQAVREVARDADLMIVVGSENSSNSKRLVEVARRCGTRAHLVDDPSDVELSWLSGATTIGLSAGASAPPSLVDEVVAAIGGLGGTRVTERTVTSESVQFTLPKEVRS